MDEENYLMANPDQAESLRKRYQLENKKNFTQITSNNAYKLAVASGKGGVGKSNIALNLAIALHKELDNPNKILLVDADINLSNLDILLGVNINKNIHHVFSEGLKIEDIIIEHKSGIYLLPATSGSMELLDKEIIAIDRIINVLNILENEYDIIIFDCAAGIDRFVLDFVRYADEAIIVVAPEQTSIIDGYAIIKLISLENEGKPINIVINRYNSSREANDIYEKLELVIGHFLNANINFLGKIENDLNICKAEKQQIPFILFQSYSGWSRSIRSISSKLYKKYINFKMDQKKIKNIGN